MRFFHIKLVRIVMLNTRQETYKWRSFTWDSLFIFQAEALVKAYPPFVNFFENTKETIQKCDKTNPRFHAFLKVCV